MGETAEEAIASFTDFGFRPDPSVAFHIMPSSEGLGRFIALAAHNSVGSTVYVYGSVHNRGNIIEARENDVFGGITAASFMPALYCYQYDPSNTVTPVVKKPGSIKIAPDPKDKTPARMIVTVAAQ